MEIRKFLGLKNTTSPERLKPGQLAVAQNVDIDDTQKLLERFGATRRQSGGFHSIWCEGDVALVMSGPDMYRVNADFSLTFMARLSSSARASFNLQQGVVYFSNGADKGRVKEGRVLPWGIATPEQPPATATIGGLLPAGRYLYAVTYRRRGGLESGTGTSGTVDLAASGGISFTGLASSTDPEVSDKIVYLSGTNGTELFRAAVLDNSVASYDFRGSPTDLTVRLDTQYVSPPPAGSIVEVYNGCAYVVVGDAAFYSDPYQLENFRLREQFLAFPGQVTMFASVNDGIYVSTGETTWFLAGGHPKGDMKSQIVFNHGAIRGTTVKTVVGVLKDTSEDQEGAPGGTAVMWASPQGVCIGAEGGRAVNMTERDFAFPSAQRGAAIIRQERGYTQFLTALEGSGVAGNSYS